MKKNIEIVPYDPNWPYVFETEKLLITEDLGDNCLEVHHIGSTSVPGLDAKPKIDMIIVVRDLPLARKQFEKIGIEYRGEIIIPMNCFFAKRTGDIDLNIHVYIEQSNPEIELNLMFRDYLRTHSEARDAYAKLKYELLQDETSYQKANSVLKNYTLRKNDFVKNIWKKASFNRILIRKCNDDKEWEAAKHFRDTYFFRPMGIDDPYTWTFDHKEHEHLVLYKGVDIIGYAHIQFWPDSRAALRIIAIDENNQNKNYGSEFLIFIEKWLKTLDVKSLHAESNPTSFYIKNGYVGMPFHAPDGQDNPEDISMGKNL